MSQWRATGCVRWFRLCDTRAIHQWRSSLFFTSLQQTEIERLVVWPTCAWQTWDFCRFMSCHSSGNVNQQSARHCCCVGVVVYCWQILEENNFTCYFHSSSWHRVIWLGYSGSKLTSHGPHHHSVVIVTTVTRDLDVIVDSQLTISAHVSALCRLAYA